MKNKKLIIVLSAILIAVFSFGIIKYIKQEDDSFDNIQVSSTDKSSEPSASDPVQEQLPEDKIYNELVGNLKDSVNGTEISELKALIKEILEIPESDSADTEKSNIYKKIIKILDDVTVRKYSEEELNSYKELFEKINNPPEGTDAQGIYKIGSDGDIVLADNMENDSEENRRVWENAKKIIPVDLLSKLDYFEPFDTIDSEGAVYGFVRPDDLSAPKEWTLGVYRNAKLELLPHVLIHEFGHYISMKDSSTTIDQISGEMLEGEMLEGFVEKGLGSIYDESRNIEKDRYYLFYARHRDDFVSAYASTSILEDFAETFVKFVSDTEYESDILKRKMSFMSENEELVEAKKKIKDNLHRNGIEEIKNATK